MTTYKRKSRSRKSSGSVNSPASPGSPSSPVSDSDLARLIRAGSPPASAQLIARHDPLIRSIISSLKPPPSVEFDDLLQVGRMTFLSVARKWNPDSTTGAKLTTYATVCVRRAIVKELLSPRYRPIPQSADPEFGPDSVSDSDVASRFGSSGDSTPGDSDPAELRQDAQDAPDSIIPASRLFSLLPHLTAQQRRCLTLWYGIGSTKAYRDAKSVAKRMRVTAGHAQRLHDEGIRRLRRVAGVD